MAIFLRGLFWLGVLGGAATGIAFPTKGAVDSIYNRQKIRTGGWTGKEAQDYENYWYGEGGFGDARTTQVSDGNWQNTIDNALKGVRDQWGKQDVGKGLSQGFKGFLDKKNICKNGNASSCFVGAIEFIEDKDKAVYGRIPIKDGNELKNVYVKWMKCTKDTKKSGGLWVGKFKKQNGTPSGGTSSGSSSQRDDKKWKWCVDSIDSTTQQR